MRRVLLCVDCFGVLEVPVTADDAEIKKAYRKKLIVVHPDKNPGKARCEEAFDRVKPFEKIGKEEDRARYAAGAGGGAPADAPCGRERDRPGVDARRVAGRARVQRPRARAQVAGAAGAEGEAPPPEPRVVTGGPEDSKPARRRRARLLCINTY